MPSSITQITRWYYSVDGKAQGPVDQEYIVEAVQANRLGLFDLVFKEGASEWQTIGETAELKLALNREPAGERSDVEHDFLQAGWVILKPRDGEGFVQHGPYTAEQILEQIASGAVQFSHYTWKPGYKRWVRIGNLPEFDRRKRDREHDPVNQVIPLPNVGENELSSNDSSTDLLGHVETYAEAPAFPNEFAIQKPAEASGENLVNEPGAAALDSIERIDSIAMGETSSYAMSEEPVGDIESIAHEAEPQKPRATNWQRPARLFAAGVTAGLMVIFGFHFLSQKHSQTPSQQTKVVDIEPLPKVDQESQASIQSPPENQILRSPAAPEAKPETRAKPSVLEVSGLKLNSDEPQLVFQTDIAAGEKIEISVIGRMGKILKWPSYDGRFSLVREPGALPTLDLSKVHLPEGTYDVTAMSGDLKTETKLFIGKSDPQGAEYREQLHQHTKWLSQKTGAERRALYYTAKAMGELSDKLKVSFVKWQRKPKQWKEFYAAWNERKIKANRAVKEIGDDGIVIFSSELSEYQAAYKNLSEQARMANHNASLNSAKSSRKLASQINLELSAPFKKISQKTAATKFEFE